MSTPPANSLSGSLPASSSPNMNGHHSAPPSTKAEPKNAAQIALGSSGAALASKGMAKPIAAGTAELEKLSQEHAKLEQRFNIVSTAKNSLMEEKARLLAQIQSLQESLTKTGSVEALKVQLRKAESERMEESKLVTTLKDQNSKLQAQMLKISNAPPSQPLSARGSQNGSRDPQGVPAEVQRVLGENAKLKNEKDQVDEQLKASQATLEATRKEKEEALSQYQAALLKLSTLQKERLQRGGLRENGLQEPSLQSSQQPMEPVLQKVSAVMDKVVDIQQQMAKLKQNNPQLDEASLQSIQKMLEASIKKEVSSTITESQRVQAQLIDLSRENERLKAQVTVSSTHKSSAVAADPTNIKELSQLIQQLKTDTKSLEQEKAQIEKDKIEAKQKLEVLLKQRQEQVNEAKEPIPGRLQRLKDQILSDIEKHKIKFAEFEKVFKIDIFLLIDPQHPLIQQRFVEQIKLDGFCNVWRKYGCDGDRYLSDPVLTMYRKFSLCYQREERNYNIKLEKASFARIQELEKKIAECKSKHEESLQLLNKAEVDLLCKMVREKENLSKSGNTTSSMLKLPQDNYELGLKNLKSEFLRDCLEPYEREMHVLEGELYNQSLIFSECEAQTDADLNKKNFGDEIDKINKSFSWWLANYLTSPFLLNK